MAGEILSDRQIKELIAKGSIKNAEQKLVNPGSLDLRLGNRNWKLTGSVLPLEGQRISDLLEDSGVVDTSYCGDRNDFYLDQNTYLFKAVESLDLPANISARAFNKSGRGRVGTSVRTLCEGVPQFDTVPAGYAGDLFCEIRPTSFPELVSLGETAMPQIRFYFGQPTPLSGSALVAYVEKEPILLDQTGAPVRFSNSDLERICESGKFTFTADLSKPLLAYRAKRDGRVLDLSKKNHYNPYDFFEEVQSDNGKKGLLIHPGDFVLIKSNEKICLPLTLAAEISDYTTQIGDFKSHYAGLINPGHGWAEKDSKERGAHIVFEVRARDAPIYLQHGQPLAQFQVYRMAEPPQVGYMEKRSTNYDSLPSILPGQFKKK